MIFLKIGFTFIQFCSFKSMSIYLIIYLYTYRISNIVFKTDIFMEFIRIFIFQIGTLYKIFIVIFLYIL